MRDRGLRSRVRSRRSSGIFVSAVVLVAAFCGTRPVAAAPHVIDSFDYVDDVTAQAAWSDSGGSGPVEMADSGDWGDERVMKLPCDFTMQFNRCYWDRTVSLDLSAHSLFELEVFVPTSEDVSQFSLHFHSGNGWFSRTLWIEPTGWQTLRFFKPDFSEEGLPGGWNGVDRIRMSVWKGADRATYLAVRELRAQTPDVFIVRDDLALDSAIVQRTVAMLSDFFEAYDVSRVVMNGAAIEDGHLTGAGMAILPYNETIPESQMARIEDHVASGGTIMVLYLLSDPLEALLGIGRTGWRQGDFAAFRFDDDAIQHLPGRVRQSSWNITVASPGPLLHA